MTGNAPLTRAALDAFIGALRRFDGPLGRESQNTARALVLLASDDLAATGHRAAYLSSTTEEEPGERAAGACGGGDKPPQQIVRDISRLLALTGPTVIAIDQIDTLFAQS